MQSLAVRQGEFSVQGRRFLALREESIVSVREFVVKGDIEVLHTHSMGCWDSERRTVYGLQVELASCPTELDLETPSLLCALTIGATVALRRPVAALWLEAPEQEDALILDLGIYRDGEERYAARPRQVQHLLRALTLLNKKGRGQDDARL